MTNEEAIERLRMILDGDMTLYMMNEKDAEAVHHAIKVLEERPKFESKCVTCKYRCCEIKEKPCRECSRAWSDLYEEAENER